AAYAQAATPSGKPTVILAKTVKGYAFGDSAEAQNATHSVKKLDVEGLKRFRDRFNIPVTDDKIEEVPYYRPAEDSLEMRYMRKRRESLGGAVPSRRVEAQTLPIPGLDAFAAQLQSTKDREISTTMAFVRMITTLCKDKELGQIGRAHV